MSSTLEQYENFSARWCAGGAVPPSVNFGTPHISETIRARKLKFYIHLDRTKWFSGMTILLLGGAGGKAVERETSSCNAAQLPRFLVSLILA